MAISIGLLILRIAVGLTIAGHGAQKLFGWFKGHGLEGTAKMFEQLGFVPAKLTAFLAAVTEGGGGLLLVLGLVTPVGAMFVFSVMLVAALAVHIKKGFFIQGGGYEYNFVLGLGGLSLAFTGPGSYSLDALLGLDFGNLYWGLGAFGLGVVGALIQMALRKTPAPAKAA